MEKNDLALSALKSLADAHGYDLVEQKKEATRELRNGLWTPEEDELYFRCYEIDEHSKVINEGDGADELYAAVGNVHQTAEQSEKWLEWQKANTEIQRECVKRGVTYRFFIEGAVHHPAITDVIKSVGKETYNTWLNGMF